MASQKLSFVTIPRAVSLDATSLPVSVFVTPRLYGDETRLDAYPDWRHWTSNLATRGLRLTLAIGGTSYTTVIDTSVLRPDLWAAIFHDDTFVRSHVFNDYSGTPIISYPVENAVSAIRDIYKQAGVTLALPQPTFERGGTLPARRQLSDLLSGLRLPRDPAVQAQPGSQLDTALKFQAYHSAPTGASLAECPPDFDTLIDFHQALGSLNDFPALQRALGVVFDFAIPADQVPQTTQNQPSTIAVTKVEWLDGDWEQPADIPLLETAYYYQAFENGQVGFMTAPRSWALNDHLTPGVFGLLELGNGKFGLAQIDVDGSMHKLLNLAEATSEPAHGSPPPPHPEVFDPDATLPALRSGGLSLFLNQRGALLAATATQSQAFNQALESDHPQPRPFYAEDLVRGHRLDVWDDLTNDWSSLHRRDARYQLEDVPFTSEDEEGFVQLAVTKAAPEADGTRKTDALYLHESLARWAGWSLSVPPLGKHLSRDPDPQKAVPVNPGEDGYDPPNDPVTPFKMTTQFRVVPRSLPSLRFGRTYRLRARVVDLAGNSLHLEQDRALLDQLSRGMALPDMRDQDAGLPYLRFEPIPSPVVIAREPEAFTGAGSGLERLVIRSFNASQADDTIPAELGASDRHIAPPRTSVDLAERQGMFDDQGKLQSDPSIYALIAARDGAEFQHVDLEVAGQTQSTPLEPAARLDGVPYLPDLLARGAALRDLPGTPSGTRGSLSSADPAGTVLYQPVDAYQPRPGSATLISFANGDDWRQAAPFRLALADGDSPPVWDPLERVLTVALPKGHTAIVPLSSYLLPKDLKLMGVWNWIREQIEATDSTTNGQRYQQAIQYILQRVVEGGHWMLTPPVLLTLVHAVQQPIGQPIFDAITVEMSQDNWRTDLQTAPSLGDSDPTELAPLTAWRTLGSTDSFLIGGLRIHGSSTDKVDLLAEWEDLEDDVPNNLPEKRTPRSAAVDTIPLAYPAEGIIYTQEHETRSVGYYDRERDLLAFVRRGDKLGEMTRATSISDDAAPRHRLGDTKHRMVRYSAVATSRYREYFPQDQGLDFTRRSAPIVVNVPASARPTAPDIAYVIPTFGWQRQSDTNVKRSLRSAGGLRIYLRRPWFSSGEGEMLGATTWNYRNGNLDEAAREAWKPYISQWGMDPIWQTDRLSPDLTTGYFTGAAMTDQELSIDGHAGVVDVAAYPVAYDQLRGLWYCDLTVNTYAYNYSPFVRLALARYQPHALADAKLSRIVLAEFVQLTPGRAATVSTDPYQPNQVRVVVSGVAPRGPVARARAGRLSVSAPPTEINVRLQRRIPGLVSDLAWENADELASLSLKQSGPSADNADLSLWDGTFRFKERPTPGLYRLVIEERENISADYTVQVGSGQTARLSPPGRLIYAEFVELDGVLV